jgi:hypothetical protein
MSSRVAPGMEISYTIRFYPEAMIDYFYDIMIEICCPIRAVGCRAMLHFTDSLDFGMTPVKHTVEKPVMLRKI